jgi:hypothetical protein
MKKTLNAFIKHSPQSKKGETFIDNNPQARSNPYEPEMSIREGIVGTTAKVAKNVAAAGAGGMTAKTVDDNLGDFGQALTKNQSGSIGAATTTQAVANRASANLAARAALSKAKATATGKTVGAGVKALNVGSKGAGLVSKGAGLVGFGLGKLAWPVAAGLAAYDAYKGYNAQPNATFGRKVTNAGQNALSGFTLGAIPAPKGIKEGILDTLILRGAKAATPIVTKVLGNLEKRVAAKAAAKETTNVVKFTPKPTAPTNWAKPSAYVATPKSATVLNMPKTAAGKAVTKLKAAQATKAAQAPKPAAPTTSRASRFAAGVKQHAPQIGAQVATQSALDVAMPNFYTPPGQDPSNAPKGFDTVGTALGLTGAALAGKNKAAWKSGTKWGLGVGAAMQGVNYLRAKDAMSKPDYKAADAAARTK